MLSNLKLIVIAYKVALKESRTGNLWIEDSVVIFSAQNGTLLINGGHVPLIFRVIKTKGDSEGPRWGNKPDFTLLIEYKLSTTQSSTY